MRRHYSVLCCTGLLAAAVAQEPQEPQAPPREWPYSMDFGPCITTTFDGRGATGFTEKGVVVRLGDEGAAAFDTELLRLSAAWVDGWLQLRGTAYDGAHGPMPSLRGHKLVETRPGPGWANDGEFGDPRAIPYGPLPKAWGTYRGLWHCGDRVVIGYRVGDMTVAETYAIEHEGDTAFVARHLELGPSAKEQRMVVLDAPEGSKAAPLELHAEAGPAALAALQWQPAAPGLVELDFSTHGWERLSMGGPSANDYLDAKSGTGATIAFVPGFARLHGVPPPQPGSSDAPSALLVPPLCDGIGATDDHDARHSVWFDRRRGGDDEGRYHIDLRRAVDVSRLSSFSWQRGARAVQEYDLFGSDAETPPALDAADPTAAGWREIARVRSGELGDGGMHGASVAKPGGLGRFRHLLLRLRRGRTFLSEIDVYADRFRAAVDGGERPPVQAAAAVEGAPGSAALQVDGGRMVMRVPPHAAPLRLKLVLAAGSPRQLAMFVAHLPANGGGDDLTALTKGGPSHWGSPLATKGARGADDEAYAVDTIAIPFDNPSGSRMRVCAFDFFSDGRAAITTWNGDVWVVDGLDAELQHLHWKRFATGLFDPLGLRIVDDVVYVHGRDGITRLHDLDGDGEADFYECFNHDEIATPAFHEFAFDLQTDAAGNFYCSKAGPVNPGGRGFMAIAPHHGTIMKISKDGQRLEVVATGLRAPNGIGVSPDGIVTSGDNEGTYVPRCRINWITAPGYYAGVKDTAHRTPVPDEPDLPLCWLPMEVDNSSGGQVWVTGDRWGPLSGRLLHLSYGTCSVYLVLTETVTMYACPKHPAHRQADPGVCATCHDRLLPAEQVQGGVVRLPCNFSSSAMRARFHPVDGQLYVAGFQGWQTSAAREGGFHRVRYTGKPLRVPVQLRTCARGVYLTFLLPLDPKTAADPANYGVEIWNYLYSQNYGSPELSILHPERKVEQGQPNRDPLQVAAARLSADRCTVFLEVPGIRPAMQMKITYNVDAADGGAVQGEVHNTIHALIPDPGFPAAQSSR